jgi:hypothetical protein
MLNRRMPWQKITPSVQPPICHSSCFSGSLISMAPEMPADPQDHHC